MDITHSTLASAFRGELEPQAANDEPASVLLQRIKADRQKACEGSLKKGRRKERYSIEPDTIPIAAEKQSVYGRTLT